MIYHVFRLQKDTTHITIHQSLYGLLSFANSCFLLQISNKYMTPRNQNILLQCWFIEMMMMGCQHMAIRIYHLYRTCVCFCYINYAHMTRVYTVIRAAQIVPLQNEIHSKWFILLDWIMNTLRKLFFIINTICILASIGMNINS
jgi:hypothetical protein